jgi:4-amino-4-deoxy-L-arabinose transferase-like glycosyltransferase
MAFLVERSLVKENYVTRKSGLLCLFILLKFLLQYVAVDPIYELHRDEYLHLDQGKHLAWGYLSVPPFTSWLSYIIILLGGSEFWVKFFPAAFGALTILVVWKTSEELKGGVFACVLGATGLLFSVLLRINLLYQPNSFDILAWTFLYFSLVKYINSQNTKWLFAAAVAFAFGFLNKYNIAFQILGLLPALLMTPVRNIFLNSRLYIALFLALILISPNLIWQYHNGFPVVHHMNELAKTQLVNVNRVDFLKEQVLFFVGSVFIIIAALVSVFTFPAFARYRVFFWSFLFTLSIFVIFKAKAYYAIGLYPILLAFGPVYLEYLTEKHRLKWLPYVSIGIILLFAIPLFRLAMPVYSPEAIHQNPDRYAKFGMLRWEDGKDHLLPQDFADMIGWKELARKVDLEYERIPRNEHTLVLCDNYGQAGAINFYSKLVLMR